MRHILALVLCSLSLPLAAQTDAVDAGTSGVAGATNKPDLKLLVKSPSFTNSIGMVMMKVGSIWAGKYPVTQSEYNKVMGSNPSRFGGQRNPVDSVSWNDAMSFCARLTEREKREEYLPPGYEYSLPTQAQWEQLMNGATLAQAVTSANGNRAGTAPVGSLAPNSLGLYDVRGNVWQWCLDPQDKPYRVLRGGAWNTFIEINLRPEFRWYSTGPDDRRETYGLRCIMRPAK